jgi:hypothetical protein
VESVGGTAVASVVVSAGVVVVSDGVVVWSRSSRDFGWADSFARRRSHSVGAPPSSRRSGSSCWRIAKF